MKKQEFNSKQLGLLSKAFLDGLLTIPKSKDLYSSPRKQNEKIDLIFSDSFHKIIDSDLRKHYYDGQFANSNSESEWNDLMISINTALETDEDVSLLEVYWLTQKDEPETKIEVNNDELNNILRKEININKSLQEKMQLIAEDMMKIYEGHSIQYNWYGYLTIERPIAKNSMFPSSLKILPIISLVKKYNLEFDTMEIKSNIGSEKIYLELYLK